MINYNGEKFVGKEDLYKCICSWLNTDYPYFEFIFVENGSTDESLEVLKRALSKHPLIPTKVIKLRENVGFGIAAEKGISESEGDFIVLVCNDERVLSRMWLKHFLKAIKRREVGAVFAKKVKWNNKKIIDAVGLTINPIGIVSQIGRGEVDNGRWDKIQECLIWQTPVMFPKSLFKKGEFFDKDYVVVNNDVDSSLRIWLKGYKILVVPSVVVEHKRCATLRQLPVEFVVFHARKNTIQTLIKNYEIRNLIKWLPITLLVYFSAILYYFSIKRTDQAKATIKAILWNVTNLKRTLRKRFYVQRYVRKIPDKEILKLMNKFDPIELLKREKAWPK